MKKNKLSKTLNQNYNICEKLIRHNFGIDSKILFQNLLNKVIGIYRKVQGLLVKRYFKKEIANFLKNRGSTVVLGTEHRRISHLQACSRCNFQHGLASLAWAC